VGPDGTGAFGAVSNAVTVGQPAVGTQAADAWVCGSDGDDHREGLKSAQAEVFRSGRRGLSISQRLPSRDAESRGYDKVGCPRRRHGIAASALLTWTVRVGEGIVAITSRLPGKCLDDWRSSTRDRNKISIYGAITPAAQ